jgi:hypothetical protein
MIESYISKYNYGYPYARLGFALGTIYLVDFDGSLGSERFLDRSLKMFDSGKWIVEMM